MFFCRLVFMYFYYILLLRGLNKKIKRKGYRKINEKMTLNVLKEELDNIQNNYNDYITSIFNSYI